VMFAGQLFLVMHIGWFTGLTLFAAVVFFDGEEIGAVMARVRRRPAVAAPDRPSNTGWRAVGAMLLCAVHVVAVTAAVMPRTRPASPWRAQVEWPLKRWVDWTTGFQAWSMFAPNGTRSALDLEVVLVDAQGREHGVGAGLVDPTIAESAWGRFKRNKVRRRLSGRKGARYHAGHARWVCRQFANTVPGDVTVVVYGTAMRMPPPAALAADPSAALQQYDRSRKRNLLHEVSCASLDLHARR